MEEGELSGKDRFSYLGSCFSPGGRILDELSTRTQKVRLAFTNLKHLWRGRDIR